MMFVKSVSGDLWHLPRRLGQAAAQHAIALGRDVMSDTALMARSGRSRRSMPSTPGPSAASGRSWSSATASPSSIPRAARMPPTCARASAIVRSPIPMTRPTVAARSCVRGWCASPLIRRAGCAGPGAGEPPAHAGGSPASRTPRSGLRISCRAGGPIPTAGPPRPARAAPGATRSVNATGARTFSAALPGRALLGSSAYCGGGEACDADSRSQTHRTETRTKRPANDAAGRRAPLSMRALASGERRHDLGS